jgi:hypothetical protein
MNTFLLSMIITGAATFDVLLFFVCGLAVRTRNLV